MTVACKLALTAAAMAVALAFALSTQAAGPDQIAGHSSARALEARLSETSASYILIDLRSGRIAGHRWHGPDRALPAGSLVKPFTGLAWAASHDFRYPIHECRGEKDGCWRPGGHGPVDIEQAVAHSCNAYFHRLASGVTAEEVSHMAARFGLAGPPLNAGPDSLIGLGAEWRESPEALLRAYVELAARAAEPGVGELLRGMAVCARSGTAAGVGTGALAKTGTAPSTHRARLPGDGFAIVLFPEARPSIAMLVRVSGSPGSHSAVVAGEALRDSGAMPGRRPAAARKGLE